MIVERSTHPQFISNTYLVADGRGGPAFFVDAGGPVGPLIDAAERLGLEPTHVLLTHHHWDHVSEVGKLLERWPALEVLMSVRERELLEAAGEPPFASYAFEAGETRSFGELTVRALRTPGHTGGMLSLLVSDAAGGPGAVFTGDTLFKDSVGGVKAPGHTSYSDLRDAIMGTLMELPPETVIHPGHADDTTVAREWEQNAFIRVWRGLDAEGEEPCTALGEPATLILLGADYDGGTKAWIRWPDGSDDIVPGSKVERGR
ncbi:MAG TPA: MBL fold metallo-hydrolase [Solirubrobacteraceae bacterium]|jgi:glyoxylase-like metal-dependent hydrolase (beta-lactamase superfamily II)